MKALLVSFQFLTRITLIPDLNIRKRDFARSLYWYPITGLLVGAGLGVLYSYCFQVLWSDLVARSLVIFILVGLKDAFHFEGMSDLADGLYGAREPAAIRQIMKDSSMGAMGCIVVITFFLMQSVLIYSLPDSRFISALAVVLMVSTSSGALLLSWDVEVLTENGLASRFVRYSNSNLAVFLEVVTTILGYLVMGWGGVVIVLTGVLVSVLFSIWIRNRLGGINGDCCGALIIGSQVTLMMVFLALFRFRPRLFEAGMMIP